MVTLNNIIPQNNDNQLYFSVMTVPLHTDSVIITPNKINTDSSVSSNIAHCQAILTMSKMSFFMVALFNRGKMQTRVNISCLVVMIHKFLNLEHFSLLF